MKPYGWKIGLWRDEDFGPPSKYRKLTSKNRRTYRRLLHKIGRSMNRKSIKEQTDELDKIL